MALCDFALMGSATARKLRGEAEQGIFLHLGLGPSGEVVCAVRPSHLLRDYFLLNDRIAGKTALPVCTLHRKHRGLATP